jgi:putative drug exporter of the RND superfamily
VRSFLTPSITVLLGRWFWWPQRVRPRPASQMLAPFGTRPRVHSLLRSTNDHAASTDRLASTPPR